MNNQNTKLEFFFHLGMPKALSTFLQQNFFPQLDILYLGKHYDSSIDSRGNSIEFEKLFKKLFGAQPYNLDSVYIDTLLQKMEILASDKQIHKILYSNENLVGTYAESFRNGMQIAYNLKKVFKEPKIILVIRKQDDFLESLYRQSIRMGHAVSVNKFLNYKNNTFGDYRIDYKLNIDLNTLNWNTLIDFYKECFGSDNVLVLPHEMIKENSEDFLKEITNFMAIEYKVPLSSSAANTRDSYLLLIIKRFINLFIYKKVQNLFIKIFFLKKVGYLINLLNIDKPFLNKKLKKEIMKFYTESNKELSKKTGLNLKKYGYY